MSAAYESMAVYVHDKGGKCLALGILNCSASSNALEKHRAQLWGWGQSRLAPAAVEER